MKTIVLLHHDFEWPEEVIAAEFANNGFKVDCRDVRQADFASLVRYDVVLNRVYASVANRDYPAVARTVELIRALEQADVRCLNGAKGTWADYDKHFASQCMSACGVRTPATHCFRYETADGMAADIRDFGARYGYPVIVKPNSGGRGVDIFKVDGADSISTALQRAAERSRSSVHDQHWLLQAFVPSLDGCDCRISVADGRFLNAYRRTLLATDGGTPWLGSRSMGSKVEVYQPTAAELDVALGATRAIEADCNMLDIVTGPQGPEVIENNPTPDFVPSLELEGFDLFIGAFLNLIDPGRQDAKWLQLSNPA